MDHKNREATHRPFKKARAKKLYTPVAKEWYSDEEVWSFIEMLNCQVLQDISAAIISNKSADLNQIIESYTKELEKIIPTNSVHMNVSEPPKKDYPCYFRHKFSAGKYFTDSFIALASIFKINPLANKSDALSCLLDRDPECQESERFAYISIQDVVKSKGNAIHGPKRENIGKFNRKLFETYSRELESIYKHRLVVNLKFCPSFNSFLGNDQLLSSDYVSLVLFSGPRRISIGEHILTIHKNNKEKKFCTIKSKDTSIFIRAEDASFCSALSVDKKRINLMYLPTLSLYSIEFLCEDALTFAYESFFRNCHASAAAEQ